MGGGGDETGRGKKKIGARKMFKFPPPQKILIYAPECDLPLLYILSM